MDATDRVLADAGQPPGRAARTSSALTHLHRGSRGLAGAALPGRPTSLVEEPAARPPTSRPRAPSRRRSVADSTIRVDVALLDTLMNLVGELVLTRNQILQRAGDAARTSSCSAPRSGST